MMRDINKLDQYGETVLMAAVRINDWEAVLQLLSLDADITIENSEGKIASEIANELGFEDIFQILNLYHSYNAAKSNGLPDHNPILLDRERQGKEEYDRSGSRYTYTTDTVIALITGASHIAIATGTSITKTTNQR